MGSLLLYSSEGFLIKNRVNHDFPYIIQVIATLLTTSSPLDEKSTSLHEFIGQNDLTSLQSDIAFRIKNLEGIMKKEYGLKRVSLESLEKAEDGRYRLQIYVQNVKGQSHVGTVIV